MTMNSRERDEIDERLALPVQKSPDHVRERYGDNQELVRRIGVMKRSILGVELGSEKSTAQVCPDH